MESYDGIDSLDTVVMGLIESCTVAVNLRKWL
jgi:hypothetical protein